MAWGSTEGDGMSVVEHPSLVNTSEGAFHVQNLYLSISIFCQINKTKGFLEKFQTAFARINYWNPALVSAVLTKKHSSYSIKRNKNKKTLTIHSSHFFILRWKIIKLWTIGARNLFSFSNL